MARKLKNEIKSLARDGLALGSDTIDSLSQNSSFSLLVVARDPAVITVFALRHEIWVRVRGLR